MMLKRASGSGAQADTIITSPYKRAIQTAEIAASVWNYSAEILRANALVPDSNPEEVWTEIRCFPDSPSILLVTHEPLVSETLAWLLGVSRVGKGFPTAGLACIDVDPGASPRGKLRYMLTPDGTRGM
jgi:phosphohistidine phosphatase SixA